MEFESTNFGNDDGNFTYESICNSGEQFLTKYEETEIWMNEDEFEKQTGLTVNRIKKLHSK